MSSKNKTIFLSVGVVSVLVMASALFFNEYKNPFNIINGRADTIEYTLLLDENNAVLDSGLAVHKTAEKRSNISFTYTGVGSFISGHTKLNAGGSLINNDQLTSITSINAKFSGEGGLFFRASYNGTEWSDVSELISEETVELISLPYYIEFLTDGENAVSIDSIEYKYTCTMNPQANGKAPQIWGSITNSTVDLNNVTIGNSPFGLKLSYYNDIYSRGFAWATDSTISDSKLYVVESSLGRDADFSATSVINGENLLTGGVMTHKAFKENLSPSTVYSYKVGSESGWDYGTFKTAPNNPPSIRAIQISDAQTKDPYQLYVWENTFAQAIETAGRKLDTIIYNGDQNQLNSQSPNTNQVDFSSAIETVRPYLGSTPYMALAGNHDTGYVFENTCVDFTNPYDVENPNNMYYSYDYGNTHFIVLNTNQINSRVSVGRRGASYVIDPVTIPGTSFTVDSTFLNQGTWLVNDLENIDPTKTKWIVVTMHAGPHSTGDHSSEAQIEIINESFTPIFSAYHVDLVMQAHDHTFAKTYPYRWDTVGHTTTSGNSAIVNYNPTQTTFQGKTYDINPNGTYYVTTGAAGHRYGAAEGDSGICADLNHSTGEPVMTEFVTNKANSFVYNKYKTEVGRITQSNSYVSFDAYVSYGSVHYYYSDQNFHMGDYAAGNINANMFGILNIDSSTLTYDFYTVRGNEVRLFDTLNIMKTQ